jgi:hypothetical protein
VTKRVINNSGGEYLCKHESLSQMISKLALIRFEFGILRPENSVFLVNGIQKVMIDLTVRFNSEKLIVISASLYSLPTTYVISPN